MKLSQWQLRFFVLVGWVVLIGVFYIRDHEIDRLGNVLAASSPWVQTDWSGGTASGTIDGTVTTYNYESNVNTGSPGQFSLDATSGWYNSSWMYRRKITFDNTTSNLGVTSEVLTNFPVLVKLTSSTIDYANTEDEGEDVRFTDSDGTTLLSYEIEQWEKFGSSYIWVKIPQIDINSNTDYMYVYYGNSGAGDGQSASSVWDSNYYFVYHMDETSGVFQDSTNNNFDASIVAVNSQGNILGKIGNASGWDGVDDYIRINQANTDTYTYELWVKQNGSGDNIQTLLTQDVGGNNGCHNLRYTYSNNSLQFSGQTGGSITTTKDLETDFAHLVITNDISTNVLSLYYNGSLVQSAASTDCTQTFNNRFWYGRAAYVLATNDFNGIMDELRVSVTARSAAWIAASYRSEVEDFSSIGSQESYYLSSGTLISNIFDSGISSDWGILTYTSSGSGIVTVRMRTDTNPDMNGAIDWESCTAILSGSDVSANNCVDDIDRYIQYQVSLASSGINTPVFEDIGITFVPSDKTSPNVNAADFSIPGLITSNDWYGSEPIITWTEGVDDLNGNGILGYCISLDEADQDSSHGLDPQSMAGILQGKNDGVTQNYCPYILIGEEFDISQVTDLDLQSGKEYFFSIKAVDLAGNVYTEDEEAWKDVISFKYDNEEPTPPFYISLPANFLSSKDVVITWPVGVGGADDIHSGLAGLQYRIGDTGTWYGDLHTGTEDINDLLVNDGSYVTDETYDYPELLEGNNLVYFRAVDNLGNITAPENYVKGLVKLNTVAPSPVRNLTVSPPDSEMNSYAFDWDPPATFTGSASGITYCYSINALPSENTCTFTSPGTTQLTADAFATQPGSNTMYVVAKDEAGNINYATYSEPGSSVSFTYSGTAPGIPHNLDVADISVKATQNWRLVLSWDKPENVGAGISYYNIYRSKSEVICSNNFSLFSKVGSSTSTSYIDPNLEQKNYYYCVKACDSANNCSASSGTVGKLPTGKYTAPAELLSPPEVVSFTTKKAVISWVTDRVSDSSIEYGLTSGKYFEEEISNGLQIANHTISLNNLQPGTTYYYRAKWTDVDGNIGVSEEKIFATLPPPKVIEVQTREIRTDSALVVFTVSAATSVDLLYGSTLSYGGSVTTATSTAESTYSVRLTNLSEETVYNFKFILIDIEANDYDSIENHRFSTLPFPRIQDIQVEEVKNSAQPTVNVNWMSNVPIGSQITYYPLDNTEQKRDKLELELTTEHKLEITELLADKKYGMVIRGRDALGNQAESEEYEFTTAADSRPPAISNIKVETRISSVSSGEQAQTQLILSWDTDEESTSQVEYGEGSSGTYTQRSLVDDSMTFNHMVIVNNLRPSSVYHFRVISEDSAGNESQGRNMVTITAQVSENPLDIIISRLTEVFGFIR